MSWKAKAQLFHDPTQAEFQPGDVVPDAVVADSPWLVEAGLVVDPKAKPVAQNAPAAEQPAADDVNPDDPEAVPADEEG